MRGCHLRSSRLAAAPESIASRVLGHSAEREKALQPTARVTITEAYSSSHTIVMALLLLLASLGALALTGGVQSIALLG